MKNIQESFENIRGISEYIKTDTQINEGLKDWFKVVKDKFKKAWQYLKGVVVKLGTYFLPVDADGEIMPAISPLTAGSAYKEGLINKDSTCVILDKIGAKIADCTTKYEDALKLYGSGDSRQYWGKILKEGDQKQEIVTIIENYMKDLAERRPDLLEETEKSRYIKSELEKINEVKLQNSDPEAKYNIIVDDDKLKNRIKMTLKNKKLARLMIWGAPGIGKSAILLNIINEMRSEFPDYTLITKTLSNETPDNFTLPTYVETEGGRKADDVPKTWLPVYKPTGDPVKDAQLDEACGKGLLFIDELSRATSQVLNVILPLVNEGIFNGYNLGSGWTIIVASNRSEDDEGQEKIGNALANRFAQVYYEPTVHTWRKWADKQHYISPLLLQWLSLPESENMSGAKYYYMDPNEDFDSGDPTKLMCTPRSWSNAMRILAEYSHTGSLEGFTIFDIDRDIIASALNECIPAQAIDSFLAFLDVIQKIGDFDRAVDAVWNRDGKGFSIAKKDLNKVTLPVAQLVCTSHNTSLPTEKEFVSLANWLVSCDSDQLASYVLDVFKSTFINTKNVQLSTSNTDAFFIAKLRIEKLKAAGKNNEAKLVENMYKPVCDNWGISLDEIPNYYTGLQIITKKYGESFRTAVVGDHIDALG